MILLDFESRSRADLKAVGGRLYWEHPSTEALCCVLHDTETGHRSLWLPGDAAPYDASATVGAHNWSGFDRFAAMRLGWPTPAVEIDTAELARRAGLPGALDALGTRWLGIPKDKSASAFTRSLSTCRRPSGKGPEAVSPAEWRAYDDATKRRLGVQKTLTPDVLERVAVYCDSDVEILAQGWPLLQPYHAETVFAPGGWEADVLTVDRIVNDRGILFDSELARRLLECDSANSEAAIALAGAELGMSASAVRAVAQSPVQFAAATGLPDAQAATVQGCLLDTCGEPRVHALCRARQALATIASGKLRAGLARVSADGRMRSCHRYYGAHTGRWSGAGMQLQNFPRPSKDYEQWNDDDVCTLVDAILAGYQATDDGITLALRACFHAGPGRALVVRDFSGVEARALAWCAGDSAAVDVFRSGRDVYKVAASAIFGVSYDAVAKAQRQIGKVSELACGYQGGPNALLKMARANRVDLAALGVDPRAVVDAWRSLHAPIVRFWAALDAAFRRAVDGTAGVVDRFVFEPSNSTNAVAIILPSGRPIVYNDTGMAIETDSYGKRRNSPYYVGGRGREHVYGGMIAENIIQALCRDLMADALVRAEEDGLCPVLHVHDEIVIDVDAAAARDAEAHLQQIMTTLPDWADGFPVDAAGHSGRRYRK